MSTKNKEVKEITDIDLDTGTNLVTENYQLEILGLKDLVDLRKFSRSFLKVDKLLKSIFTGKEDKIDKKSAFNKEFGVAQNEVLEGSKLAEILGIEYGGVLNNNNQKIAGKGYYDTANKKIYKCTISTSINYADAAYFIEVSNNDLLGKLQNLPKIQALTIDIPSGQLNQTIRRERKTFDISVLNIKPIYIFPYVPATSTGSGTLYFECVSIVSFNNNNIIVDFDYGGSITIGIEAKATILYYE